MIHVRIVAPEDVAHQALEVLSGSEAVLNIVHLHGAATKPPGDVILCDVAREDASVILGDLKELEIPRVGSIAVEHIDISMSDAADEAEKAAPGLPSDAVVWEEVEQRTSENTELSSASSHTWCSPCRSAPSGYCSISRSSSSAPWSWARSSGRSRGSRSRSSRRGRTSRGAR
jgi:hypothetical protein